MADGDFDFVESLCGPGKSKLSRNTAIPEIAQLYALGLFRADFRSRYPMGETFSEWDLVGNVNLGMGQPALDLLLRRIKSDFRNYYSKSQRNRKLIQAGTPASGLREGRSIRADGLGIALDPLHDAIVAELLEVTTIDEADATILEDIQPKVALLRGPIKTLVERELAEARLRISARLPQQLIAYGTPWVIPPALAVVPIFQAVGTAPPATYRWICFGPTYHYRPMPFGPFVPSVEPELAPARGLILYSFHQASMPQGVPHEVMVRFAEWTRQKARAMQRLELLPMPEMARYWHDNNRDLKTILAYAALATLAIAAVVLAVYLAPVMAGAAAATLSELTASASIEAIAANAPRLIATISEMVPTILNFSRTALSAASAAGPSLGLAF